MAPRTHFTAQTCSALTVELIPNMLTNTSCATSSWDVPNTCVFACEPGYTASGTNMTCTGTDTYTADAGSVPPTCVGTPMFLCISTSGYDSNKGTSGACGFAAVLAILQAQPPLTGMWQTQHTGKIAPSQQDFAAPLPHAHTHMKANINACVW